MSSFLQKLKLTSSLQVRWLSSKVQVTLTSEVQKLIDDEIIKPRKHPGVFKGGEVELPKWIVEAMNRCLEDVDRSQLFKESKKLENYLFSRRIPIEGQEMNSKYKDIESKYLGDISNLSDEEISEKRKVVKGITKKKLLEKVFTWKPLEFNNYRSLLYMITRSTPEYAVLHTIFNEIQTRDPSFNPQTIFDFGSGVGTVLWAVRERWKNINEYLAVDISNDMNDLSEKIMSLSPSEFKKAFYRQYLPVTNLKYDLVVSAYSLMELPDAKSRLAAIAKLWKKTNKYLVIVEQGTNAGFKLVNEAHEFVKYVMNNIEVDENYFTFAPCPHDLACPRIGEGQTPCNFLVGYKTLPLLGPSKPRNELYSYVILKKGERSKTDNWFRIVRPTLIRSRHVICRMCTSDGNLQENIFTPTKHGKILYRCAKASKWGDRLPVEKISEVDTTEQILSSESNEIQESITETETNEIQESITETETEIHKEEKEKEKCLVSEAPFSHTKDSGS